MFQVQFGCVVLNFSDCTTCVANRSGSAIGLFRVRTAPNPTGDGSTAISIGKDGLKNASGFILVV